MRDLDVNGMLASPAESGGPVARDASERGMAAYGGPAPYYGYGLVEEERFDPLRLVNYILRYRWFLATMAALAIVAGGLFTFMQTAKYQATARMEVLVPSARVIEDLQVVAEGGDVRAFLTAREKLVSRALAERVVFELNLAAQPDFLFPRPDFALANILDRAFGRTANVGFEDLQPAEREKLAISRILENVSAELVNNTSLLEVNYRDQDPVRASEIANQIARSFIDQRVDRTSETSSLARQFIEEQVVQVKERLQSSEQELVDYAKSAGLTIDDTNSSLILANIRTINDALAEAIQQRLEAGRLVEQVESGHAESLPQVLNSEGIQRIRDRIAELSAEYQLKLGTFKPDFPEMRQLNAQIAELRRQIGMAIEGISNSVRLEYADAQASETDLRKKLNDLEREQSEFQDKNIDYTILKREVDSNRSQYESLIAKLNEVGVGAELRTQSVALVDQAVAPEEPYSPRLPINMAISLALFAVGSAGTIYVRELLNNTFTSPEQIENELHLPVLGIVPEADAAELEAASGDPRSSLSEAYRSLRTALQFTGTEGHPRTLLVTSAGPSEGKSSTSFNLAQAFGALGFSVLLIDADLRKPSLHRRLNVENTVGLSNLLTNTAGPEDLRRMIKGAGSEKVKLLTSGTLPPNPADLLSSTKMAHLVAALRERFDLVIIDAPPIIGLSDAPILSRLTEATLMVVSSRQVSRKAAAVALKRVRSAGGQVVGAALNKFQVRKFDYDYSYGYVSTDYYGYGVDEVRALQDDGDAVGKSGAKANWFDRLHALASPRRAGDGGRA